MEPNMVGAYGEWAAGIVGDQPARLSFRHPEQRHVNDWRVAARARYRELLMQPAST